MLVLFAPEESVIFWVLSQKSELPVSSWTYVSRSTPTYMVNIHSHLIRQAIYRDISNVNDLAVACEVYNVEVVRVSDIGEVKGKRCGGRGFVAADR